MTSSKRARLQRVGLGLVVAGLYAGTAGAQPGTAPGVKLAPHQAVYDLSLLSSSGSKGVEGARGRIVVNFTGDACEGYAMNFRQVTILTGAESGERTLDLRSATFEDADARHFQFKSELRNGAALAESVDGRAERAKNGLEVRLTKPKRDRAELQASKVVFPSEHAKKVIEAARRGETTYAVPVFDGSDGGTKVYDTFAVIGRRVAAGQAGPVEAAAKNDPLAGLDRWPVSISYYAPGQGERTPTYTIAFDLYDNGVSRNLRIDYGDFALKGEMSNLEMLPPSDCTK